MQPAKAVQRTFYRMASELEEFQQVIVDITVVFNNQNVHCSAFLFFLPGEPGHCSRKAGRLSDERIALA
ncbi:hypothetical protein TOC8171_50100 [Pseudomonas syringae]